MVKLRSNKEKCKGRMSNVEKKEREADARRQEEVR